MATTNEAATRTETRHSVSLYDGFISYSHAADGLLAPRLQAGLQRFAKPWFKRRAVRVFRDESSLSANPHLWSSITEALDGSEWFVLLLSEDAASSEWVNREVEYWVAHKDASRILPVVTDGEFSWAEGDIDPSSTAAPPALSGVFSEEPRWVDLRWARTDEQLALNNPRFSDAVADIASALRGVPKDELASEEVRQHRRTIRTAWASGVVVLLLGIAATVGAIFAVGRSNEAREQRAQAEEQARLARDNERLALEAEADAREQAQIAEDERENAVELTEQLLDFTLQPALSGRAPPDRNFSQPADFGLPVPLPTRESAPDSTRLDFLQTECNARGDCYREGIFVDPEAQRGTPFWMADRPFHIRHGFANPTEEAVIVDGPVVSGYDLRVYVTRRDGPELSDNAFELNQTFVYRSDFMVRETIEGCGPPVTGPQPCDVFVHDFPEGLPPGRYDFWVEWFAPCSHWVESEFCIGVGQAITLFTSQASIGFFSEDYPARQLGRELGDCCSTEDPPPGSPFEPWDYTISLRRR